MSYDNTLITDHKDIRLENGVSNFFLLGLGIIAKYILIKVFTHAHQPKPNRIFASGESNLNSQDYR